MGTDLKEGRVRVRAGTLHTQHLCTHLCSKGVPELLSHIGSHSQQH